MAYGGLWNGKGPYSTLSDFALHCSMHLGIYCPEAIGRCRTR
ncbi:hypothetical protein GBAR_LOCUS9783 [Geodia barretti]|uniref:Uncharacterized protein n=1 Tax=Geodia barretti TaxID=519541 RepID=A0AA35RRB9_GEOBA|nr:hypothetical protein GBAR_LOCUS9783 [Geodia barretti]